MSFSDILLDNRDVFSIFPSLELFETSPLKPLDVPSLVGRRFGENCRIYKTRAHTEIMHLLNGQLNNLSSGKYVGRQGISSCTMVGAKGIGKTACLKIFARITPYLVPNVICTYISYNSVFSNPNLSSYGIDHIIAEELKKLEELRELLISAKDSNEVLSEAIVRILKEKDLCLLLLIDELDQLYKLNGRDFRSALTTLSCLAYFGSQPSGRISVILCGSTALLESLITTNANSQVREEFPLISTGALNLNGSKYVTKRVYSTLPTDLSAVASIADLELDAFKSYARLVGYSCGCSARSVERILYDGDQQSSLFTGTPENALSGGNTMGNDEMKLLKLKLTKGLIRKNSLLLREIFGNGNLYDSMVIRNIAVTEWESRFVPLNYDDVEKIWRKLLGKKRVTNGNLAHYLLHLADTCWLTFDGVQSSRPRNIYPYSFASLGNSYIDEQSLPNFQQKLTEVIKGGANSVANYIANPRPAGSTVVVVSALSASSACLLL